MKPSVATPRLTLLLALIAATCWPIVARGEEDSEPPPQRVAHETMVRQSVEAGPAVPVTPDGVQQVDAGPVLTWSPLGPSVISYDYWSTGPAAGRVSSLVVDPRDKNVVYVAAAQGGVWKTTDAGAHWAVLTDGLTSIASGALALDAANPDIVYYGTGELHDSGDSFYGDGLFKSVNGGAGWSQIASRVSVGSYIAKVAVNSSNPSILYVAGDIGVAVSLNGGATWSRTLIVNWCYDLALDPSNSNVLYAAVYGAGVYKSIDAGVSWLRLGTGLPPVNSFQRVNLAISPSSPLVLYASFVNADGTLLGMYRTADGGANWSVLGATPNYLGTQGWYDNCLVVDPTNPNICYAGGVFPYSAGAYGVIRTTNGGASWSDVTIGIDAGAVHPDQHAFAFGPDSTLWLGNDGGVWKTRDGGQHWLNVNTGLAITQFYSVAVHPASSSTMIGGTQDNGTLIYAGSPAWSQVIAGDGGDCLYLWNDPGTYLTSYVRLDPIYHWNGGGFAGSITGPWVAAGDRASFLLAPLVQDPATPNTLLAGTYRVWRSNNLGASWFALTGDICGGADVIYSIAVAPGFPNTIYAGCSNGRVFVTSDAVVWNELHAGLPLRPVHSIVVSPADPQTAYLCADTSAGGRVWATSNSGVVWTDVSGDLPAGVRGFSLAANFASAPPTLYLGTDYGVYRCADGGVHWYREAVGLPSLAVYALRFDGAGGVIAATHGRGMWRGTLTPLAVGDHGGQGAGVRLSAVHPSGVPAELEYRLPSRASIALEVFGVDGRRVRVIERGPREAGVYRTHWDGRDASGVAVSGGVYFYRLSAPGISRTARVALLR